jgi:hypothetical protein
MPQTAAARSSQDTSETPSESVDPSAQIRHRPANELRLGSIKATIWKNETAIGARYNVTFSRLYKDGEQWRSTESFGRDDLLVVAKVADQAHTWICQQQHDA